MRVSDDRSIKVAKMSKRHVKSCTENHAIFLKNVLMMKPFLNKIIKALPGFVIDAMFRKTLYFLSCTSWCNVSLLLSF